MDGYLSVISERRLARLISYHTLTTPTHSRLRLIARHKLGCGQSFGLLAVSFLSMTRVQATYASRSGLADNKQTVSRRTHDS